MDVLIVAPQSWNFEIGSNARNIAIEFSKKDRVVYVNPPIDLITLIRCSGKRSIKTGIQQIGHNLWILTPSSIVASINWLPVVPVYRLFNRFNNRRFAANILQGLAKLEFQDFVLFNDNYMFNGLYLKELLRPKHYLYYIRDFLTIQPYFHRHGKRVEPALLKDVDAVVANSTYLKEYAERFNPRSFYVGQGCEVEMFDEQLIVDIPEDMKGVKRPIVGYVGFLTSLRLDIALLFRLAKEKPHWNLVLVGPEDVDFEKSSLHELPNVFFLGRREPTQLPSYIFGFDVCINPQVINPLTIGNYPRKIDEYLAMGKPTVATATKAMEVFKEYTYLATNIDEFISMTEVALADNDLNMKQRRIDFARSHTWENSVKEIYRVINQLKSETAK